MDRTKFNKLLDFSIVTLFFTNLWIILYNGILTYVNFIFPPVVKSGLLRDIAFPNPAKTVLYLGLSAIFVLIFWVICRERFQTVLYNNFFLKIILFIILLISFVNKLGTYPLVNEPSIYPFPASSFTYSLIFAGFIGVIAFLIIESTILQKIIEKKRLFYLITLGFIILLIAIFTFEPHFPLSAHDYSFILGPIQEILNRKTIYTDIPSQHGLLPIFLFTVLYKLNLVKFAYFSAVIWILYIVQYFLSFYILFKISKSLVFSLLGMFSIIVLNYFSLYLLAAFLPQTGPLRWLPGIISLLLLLKTKKINSAFLIISVGLSFFWILDSGIALILGFTATLGTLWLKKVVDLKKVFSTLLLLSISTLGIFLVINIVQLSFGYKWIDVGNIFSTLNEYARLGIVQEPIQPKVFFWVFVMIYISSMLYFFQSKKIDVAKTALVFCANIALFSSIYYVGRSNPHNLFHITPFVILTFFILVGTIWREYGQISDLSLQKLVVGSLIFIFFIFYPAYERRTSLVQLINVKYEGWKQGQIFKPEFNQSLNNYFSQEPQFIKKNLPENKIIILDTDDTYLFYLTGKQNLLLENPQAGILTQDRLAHALSEAVKVCPRKIAVDCQALNQCPAYKPLGEPSFTVPQILQKIENDCHVKYTPIVCTQKLCIAEAK